MSINNSTQALPLCDYPSWFWTLGDLLQWSSITLILPAYLLLGIFGNLLCLLAFLKQAKSEKGYCYQIYRVLASIGEVVTFSLFMLAYQWSGINTLELGSIDGSPWFQKVYFLMFFAAHMAIPLCNALSVVCLLLSVSMAADRVFAFVKPFVYKNIRHSWHQRVALTLSVTLGFGVTFYNVFLFEVDATMTSYHIAPNIPYLVTNLALGLAYLCNATRIAGLALLIGCNLALLRLYKGRMVNMSQDSNREAQKKANERTLTLLTLCESLFTGISMLSYTVFYTAAYTVPSFNVCEHRVFAPVLDILVMLSDIANTCASVAINKKTRKILRGYLNFFKGWKIVRVQPAGDVAGPTHAPSASGHGLTNV